MKNIFLALDFTEPKTAKEFILNIDPNKCRVKVGKALFTAAGPNFIEYLHQLGFDVFLDLKFHDIPNTVKSACEACASLGVHMLTVHTMGGLDMLLAAKEGVNKFSNNTMIMGVTVLTSFMQSNLDQIGVNRKLEQQVLLLADLAFQAKLDGIVCSAHEVALLKAKYHNQLKLLTPGIRLSSNNGILHHHDQNRVMTPKEAILVGSDYLVIGRAVTEAKDPNKVLDSILKELNGIY